MNFYGFLTWVTARRQERGVLNKINDAPINGWAGRAEPGRTLGNTAPSTAWTVSWSRDWWSEAELMFWNVTIYWCEVWPSAGTVDTRVTSVPYMRYILFPSPENNNMFYECCSQYVKYLDKESERCALFSKFITFSVLFISWMFMISPAFIISARLLGGIAAPQPSCGKLNFPYF